MDKVQRESLRDVLGRMAAAGETRQTVLEIILEGHLPEQVAQVIAFVDEFFPEHQNA